METEWSFDDKPPRFYHTLCYMEEYPDAADAFADEALAKVMRAFADLSNFAPEEGEHS